MGVLMRAISRRETVIRLSDEIITIGRNMLKGQVPC
jgi:hypothetical protein